MSNIFFWSDPHLFHEKTFTEFKDQNGNPLRPFASLDEMHERMVDGWNSVVRDRDKGYWLGDITFRYDHDFELLMGRFRGAKRLILGNHDDLKKGGGTLARCFSKINLWRGFYEQVPGFLCSHLPIHPDHIRKAAFNLHGHTHDKQVMISGTTIPDPRYRCVCVEQTGYVPISFDELVADFTSRADLIQSAQQDQQSAASSWYS